MSKKTKKIFNLRDEVLTIAAGKNHAWEDDDNQDIDYGKAGTDYYGHVKTVSDLMQNTKYNDSHCPTVEATKSYVNQKTNDIINDDDDVTDDIKKTKTFSRAKIEEKLSVIDSKSTEVNETQKNFINGEINKLKNSLQGEINELNTYEKIKDNDTISIDNLKTPGYYYHKKDDDFNKSIVIVQKTDESIIQYIEKYGGSELTGDIYQRVFTNGEWKTFLVYKQPVTRETPLLENDKTKITIRENTAGYIFTWIQKTENKTYEVQGDLYEYYTLVSFDGKDININEDEVFIFGNLIGKIDVKITSDGIDVRSTLPKGNVIKNVHASFFVPRGD